MPGPIKPEEVDAAKAGTIPEVVFEVFNNFIATNWRNGSSSFRQDEVVEVLVEEKGLERDQIFDKNWLDVEDAYQQVGWKVTYDKPAYNETYPATFTFVRPKK